MKIRMRTSISARTYSYSAGSIVDVPYAEAQRWISAGIAEPVRGTRETATPPAYETAAMEEPEHVGGGWYEVAGERVQGREAAIKRMRENE